MDRVALITGASRGIGAATARELGRHDYHVIVNYRRDEASARAVVDDIQASGGSAQPAQADVCDPVQVADLVATCGRIDALICNANIQPTFAPFDAMPWGVFSAKISNELAAAFHVSQRAIDVMRRQGAGRIVYISSLSVDLVRHGAIAHATAKAALETFARHVAAEAGKHGISVNTIAPGVVRTDASAQARTPELESLLAEHSVLRRVLEPEDVAAVIGAVVDGKFHGVTGTRIPVDGGFRLLAAP
jgi:3-oxoacyl-[acyl-carrier protein] reductase